jgi:hypothetical protein
VDPTQKSDSPPLTTPGDGAALTPEQIARAFHDAYEALAPAFGYRTREASAKPWEQIPASNRDLMIATVRAVFYERDGAFFVCGPSAPIAAAPVLSFDDALRIARGCTDYCGGHSDDALEVYHHGVNTVINALTAAADRGLADTQVRALHRMGAPSSPSRGPEPLNVQPPREITPHDWDPAIKGTNLYCRRCKRDMATLAARLYPLACDGAPSPSRATPTTTSSSEE